MNAATAAATAARFGVRYVAATNEFLVSDKTGRFAQGYPVCVTGEQAAIEHMLNVLRDEAGR